MPFNPDKRREYDRKRYDQQKAKKPAGSEIKKVFFPLRIPEPYVAVAHHLATEGLLTGRTPWRTPGQVFVHAIAVGLKDIQAQYRDDDKIALTLDNVEHETHLSDVSRDRRTAQSLLAKAKTEVAAVVETGQAMEGAQLYKGIVEGFESMRHSVWNDWLVGEMTKAFPDLEILRTKRKIKGVAIRDRRHTKAGRRKLDKELRDRSRG